MFRRIKRFIKGFLKLRKDINAESANYVKDFPHLRRTKIKLDMYMEHIRTGIRPYEYYCFRFYDKNRRTRDNYILHDERVRVFTHGKWNKLPKDKYKRYLMFKDYFKREVIPILFDDPKSAEAYAEFSARHDAFIAKPLEGTKDHSAKILQTKTTPDISALCRAMGENCIIEELIEQGEELKVFHPSSINTVRVATVSNGKDRAAVLYTSLCVGKGGSVVDNVGSGGIVMRINNKTGVIATDGKDGDTYIECHPDTRIRFKGSVMPDWNTLIDTAVKAHLTMPGQRLIGWDFAWTTRGWEVVEVNPSPAFENPQLLLGTGMKAQVTAFTGPF